MAALIQFYVHNKYKYALVGLIRAITDSAWCSKSGKIAAAHLEMNVMRFQFLRKSIEVLRGQADW